MSPDQQRRVPSPGVDGVESGQVAIERGRLDAMIAGLLFFMAGMGRSKVSALGWPDAADGDGILVTVRHSKTNLEGGTRDVRFVKDGVARALRTLRAAARRPEDQLVPLSPQMVGLQFAAAARAGRPRARLPPSVSVGAAPREIQHGPVAGPWRRRRRLPREPGSPMSAPVQSTTSGRVRSALTLPGSMWHSILTVSR